MSSMMKSLSCAVIIASLVMPSPVFANSLRLPSPQKNAEQAQPSEAQSGEEGEPLKLPSDNQAGAQNSVDAQKAADDAQKAAEEAQKAAEEARKTAEAQNSAEVQEAAEEAQKAADEAQNAAEQAQKAAEAQNAEEAQEAAADAQKAADEAQNAAEEAQKAAEAQKAEEAAQAAAEAQKAEEAQKAAEEQKAAGAQKASGKKEAVTGLAMDKARDDLKGKALVIPEGAQDASFMEGGWNFDRLFVRPDGVTLGTEFAFDENGLGTVSFVDDKGVRHTAPARAAMSDGALKIQTGTFSNPESPYVYYPEFMECRNSGGAAVCNGSDGFSSWEGGRLIGGADTGAAQAASGAQSAAQPSAASGAASGAQNAPAGAWSALPGVPGMPAPEEGNFTEVSDEGAELAPDIMASAEKAKMKAGSDAVSALAGDWRFSRDLARKSDGESVALEFHFDENGKGYSLIREGSGKEFKAAAEAAGSSKGTLRVRTGAYSDGKGHGYYPTFMECSSGRSAELLCDVSNGWTRIEGGSLVSKDFLDEQDRQMSMEELLPVAPEPGADAAAASGSADASQAAAAGAQTGDVDIAGMLAELSANSAAQSAAAAAQSASSSQSRKESSRKESRLSLPANDKSMSFLEGYWRCNTGLVRTSDNQPVVMEFRFDRNGRGTATIREREGYRYDASARATYKKGVLRINTSDFRSKDKRAGYNRNYMECSDQGGQAICNGRNGGITWSGATFVRLK